MKLEDQTRRGIELFESALANRNLTAAATALKHLSDLHGLTKLTQETKVQTLDPFEGLDDQALDQMIEELSKQ